MAQYYEAIGRRKESTARVRVANGTGTFTVNEKEAGAYFPRVGDLQDVLRAFNAVGQDANRYDITVKVNGETIVDYTEPENPLQPDPTRDRRLSHGTIALQAHDPGSTVHYRDIRIKPLPE